MLTKGGRIDLNSGDGSLKGESVLFSGEGDVRVSVTILDLNQAWPTGPSYFLSFEVRSPTTSVHFVLPVATNLVTGWLLDRLRWQGQCRFKEYTVTHAQDNQHTRETLVFTKIEPKDPRLLAQAICGPSFVLASVKVTVDTDLNVLGIAKIELIPVKGPSKTLIAKARERKPRTARSSEVVRALKGVR